MTNEEREINRLSEFPISIRKYFTSIVETEEIADRNMDSFLRRFDVTRYPINDRTFGSNQAKVCNIIYNALNEPEVDEVIEEFQEENKWVYHAWKPFERLDYISNYYYGDATQFWVILLFNKIVDPFQASQDFNIIKIPDRSFIPRLPRKLSFDYTYAGF